MTENQPVQRTFITLTQNNSLFNQNLPFHIYLQDDKFILLSQYKPQITLTVPHSLQI